jgi:hypothetical protein
MKTKRQRTLGTLLSIVLAAAFCLLLYACDAPIQSVPDQSQEQFSTSAQAGEAARETAGSSEVHSPSAASSLTPLSAPSIGEQTSFGDIDWQVLDVRDGRALLVSQDILEMRAYNEEFIRTTWEDCSLRAYLNGEFLSKHFSNEEQMRIALANVINDDSSEYGTPGGNDTQDKVFLLSIDEIERYFSSNSERIAKYQGADYWWWLRSPGAGAYSAADIYVDGDMNALGGDVENDTGGVRPALWLNL